jgi:hypothetical protein
MTQHQATLTLAAALALAGTVSASAPQDADVDRSFASALRVRPDTLATFITKLAGLRVHVVSGVIDDIASPRVFTVTNERRSGYINWPNEVAVVVDPGSALLREGAPVVVSGIARTLLGAEVDPDRPIPSLTEIERNLVAKLPLVVASSVQTPDGVQLVRPGP